MANESSGGLIDERPYGAWEVKKAELDEVAISSRLDLTLARDGVFLRLASGRTLLAQYRDIELYRTGRHEVRLVIRGRSIWLRSVENANAGDVERIAMERRWQHMRAVAGVGYGGPDGVSVADDGSVSLWGIVLASSQLPGLDHESRCFLEFGPDRVTLGRSRAPEDLVAIEYGEVTSLNLGGRGVVARTTGGGFIGGGFGVQGAVEGMLMASALNALTRRTETMIETIVELAAGSRAVLLLNSDEPPDQLRIHLAPAFARIEQAHRPVAGGGSGVVDRLTQLKQLGELRDAGVLTPEEFESEKARILRSQ